MPQLWLTCEEFAAEFGGDADEVEALSVRRGWKRKRSGDGLCRVQLPDDLALAFFQAVVDRRRSTNAAIDDMVAQLRGVLGDATAAVRGRQAA